MRLVRELARVAVILVVIQAVIAPSSATTLIRAGLKNLIAGNATIVHGYVADVHSYWNAEKSFILSDVRFVAKSVLKGDRDQREFIVTVMGGQVGDLTSVIVAGADLRPGGEYILFLNDEDLPGSPQVRTVRDLSQGVFDVLLSKDGFRAVSQASRHPLLPDEEGLFEAPGGPQGIPLGEFVSEIRTLARGH